MYIQEDKIMQFKNINCKMKEIYFNPVIIKEDDKICEFESKFWNSMNIIGLQNMTMQSLKMA